MSVTCGFYNSINGDRRYNAEQLTSLVDGIIRDGVFMGIGDALMVSASTGMNVIVGTGRAWFNSTWTHNDSLLPLAVDPAEMILNRIDAVVLEVNRSMDVRENTIKMVKGTPASVPVPPTLIKSELVNQYALAHVYVGAGVTQITAANITNKVGTDDCPFVTGILQTLNLTALLAQWDGEFHGILNLRDSQFANLLSSSETQFANMINTQNSQFTNMLNTRDTEFANMISQRDSQFLAWFELIEATLDENVAANLLNMINNHSSDNTVHVPYLGQTTMPSANIYEIGSTITIPENGKFSVKFNAAATGPSTLKISSDGVARPLKRPGGKDFKPKIGVYTFIRDGSNFQCIGEDYNLDEHLAGNQYGWAYGVNDLVITTGGDFQYVDGAIIRFGTSNTNTGAVTLNVDGKGARPLRNPVGYAELPPGRLKQYQYYEAIYNGSHDCFFIKTNVELVAHLTDYVRQPGYAVSTGTIWQYDVTLNPAPTTYTDGMCIAIKMHADNGPHGCFINVNGLGNKRIVNHAGPINAAGKLKAGVIYSFRYDATSGNFILQGEGGEYGTAQPEHVLQGYTIGTEQGVVVGTMPNRAGDTAALALSRSGTTIKLRASNGYRDGVDDNVTHTDANDLPQNIRKGVTIRGNVGTLVPALDIESIYNNFATSLSTLFAITEYGVWGIYGDTSTMQLRQYNFSGTLIQTLDLPESGYSGGRRYDPTAIYSNQKFGVYGPDNNGYYDTVVYTQSFVLLKKYEGESGAGSANKILAIGKNRYFRQWYNTVYCYDNNHTLIFTIPYVNKIIPLENGALVGAQGYSYFNYYTNDGIVKSFGAPPEILLEGIYNI